MTRRIFTALTCVALAMAVGAACLPGGAGARPDAAAHRPPVLVYETHRATLNVSIRRRGSLIVAADVSAYSRCTNGEHTPVGFSLDAPGYAIDAEGNFQVKRHNESYFRGRFEGNKVVGAFRESFQRNESRDEGPEPRCGNVAPRGRNQRFVARLVERNGKKVGNGAP